MVGQMISQVCDIMHHQLQHVRFEHFLNTQFLLQILIVCVKLALIVHTIGQDPIRVDLPPALGVSSISIEQIADEHV